MYILPVPTNYRPGVIARFANLSGIATVQKPITERAETLRNEDIHPDVLVFLYIYRSASMRTSSDVGEERHASEGGDLNPYGVTR